MPPPWTIPRGSRVFEDLEFGPGVWTDGESHVSAVLAVKIGRLAAVTFRLYCFSNATVRASENDPIILLPDELAPWDLNAGGNSEVSAFAVLQANSVLGASYPRAGLAVMAASKYADDSFPTAIYSYDGGEQSGMPPGTLNFVTEVVPSGPNTGQPEERIECRGQLTYITAE